MTKRKKWTIAILIAMVALALVFTIAYASTQTKVKCWTKYSGGSKVARLCYSMKVEYIGDSARCKSDYRTTYTWKPGWSWSGGSESCRPSTWTTGVVSGGGSKNLYYYGVKKNFVSCAIACDAVGGSLRCSRGCSP